MTPNIIQFTIRFTRSFLFEIFLQIASLLLCLLSSLRCMRSIHNVYAQLVFGSSVPFLL